MLDSNAAMLISVVVPAFNEGAYLGETLASLNRAKAYLQGQRGLQAEIIVVDNASDDSTADLARALSATVARETQHNVAKVRNTGAKVSNGNVLVFVDADTIVPHNLLTRIVGAMSDATCFGGAVDTAYRPQKLTVRVYLKVWRIIGRLTGMAQGATQFCRREIFFALDGYDERLFMGEDVDFHWRLKRIAKRRNGAVIIIKDVRVLPSTRRFDQWRLWRTLIWTNPLFILLFRRRKKCWHGWYKAAPR
ncbi:MAG TPA: glycosyltransferase [Pyrinomonadaceae bacterium]|nr:glycosyltransferase [Pyrinomonadaceae bacterium]